jgi:hypothetical protein
MSHLSTDFSSWRSGPSVDIFIALAALVAFAFHASRRSTRPAGVVAPS